MFRSFARENRPLSSYLRRELTGPLVEEVRRLPAEAFERDTAALIDDLIAKRAITPPRLGGWRPARLDDDYGWRPGSEQGCRIAVARQWAAIQVVGEAEMLEWWPDQVDDGLIVVDPVEPGPDPSRDFSKPYDEAAAHLWHSRVEAAELWTLQPIEDPPGPVALYTFIELSGAELDEVERGERSPRAELEKMRAKIEPIVAAIRKQTLDFVEHELVEILTAHVEDRKRRLRRRAPLADNLTWPDGWHLPPARLDEASLSAAANDAEATMGVAPAKGPTDGAVDSHLLEVRHKPRLSPATFTDVQQTMRVWADAVERYPRSFGELSEDQLSDLLAATLNAALAGAQREVYQRGGKTDISITADVLAEGSGPGKVFVCESKKWRGGQGVSQGYDQLLGYLNSKDTAAVLVIFSDLRNPDLARSEAIAALTARPEFQGETLDGPAGWPILTFSTEHGHNLQLCVAVIDVDSPVSPFAEKRAKRSAAKKEAQASGNRRRPHQT
ncbi:hypothetical protein E4P40_22400 [Blastococcus sp. CT_GayMR20]|uniref:hypothetical protein n=1 Tax=Blastococcus sp. CT_GayMR20 TaxID=2559609 RepID=UPI001073DED1|nr:hypothetical protein [Blastococcus sp. CT_GayMR20]TFV69279.1 hypothetical protein E4P40_22400 [Blastococcus sp. CT_GayMR20]